MSRISNKLPADFDVLICSTDYKLNVICGCSFIKLSRFLGMLGGEYDFTFIVLTAILERMYSY